MLLMFSTLRSHPYNVRINQKETLVVKSPNQTRKFKKIWKYPNYNPLESLIIMTTNQGNKK